MKFCFGRMSCAKSIIDHFVITENLVPNVLRYESLHDGDNLSDHEALSIELSVSVSHSRYENTHTSVLNWSKAISE